MNDIATHRLFSQLVSTPARCPGEPNCTGVAEICLLAHPSSYVGAEMLRSLRAGLIDATGHPVTGPRRGIALSAEAFDSAVHDVLARSGKTP